MATLAKPEAPADPVAHHGFVVDPPAKLGDPFTVRVPDFDELYVFEIRRWEARGATIPMAGDEVLVVVDDEAEPWVPMWWPGGGDAEVISLPIKSSQIESLEASKITGQLTNAQIESIEAAKLTGQIIETQIGPEAITTPKLAAGAVVAAKIAAGTITAEQIAAATITATNIAANTITASQIKAGTITAEEIAAATITGNKIAATTIEGGHIKDRKSVV